MIWTMLSRHCAQHVSIARDSKYRSRVRSLCSRQHAAARTPSGNPKFCHADRINSRRYFVRDPSPYIDYAFAQGFAWMKVRVAAVCKPTCRRQRMIFAFVPPPVSTRCSVWFRMKPRKRRRGVHVNVCVPQNGWGELRRQRA